MQRRGLRQISLLLVILVLAGGCRTSLKSNWRDFNAYYNTFYNAKKNYQLGLEKNLGQQREYNPLQPIRIHEKPVNAGAEDFNKAIEKGADILRKYNNTRWVDDALGLIGKSYYFRQEYYSADQKFKELFNTTENTREKQEAIIWQGRVLLDMELYNQGISYLTDELISYENWDRKKRAEAQALLAQHYVNNENWDLAREQLLTAIPNLPKKEYKERGYFMLGQIYERIGDQQAAFEAYDRVQDYYTEYRLQYLAKRKKAEVARELDKNAIAYDIFTDMVRDDKNTEYISELDYELARTEQRRGNFEKAEEIYNRLLRNRQQQPNPETTAKTYYSLAEIYRFEYDDFTRASAYYDSAAQVNADPERLPENFRASDLADSFGEYTRIQNEISLQDSLLRLGRMSPEEFDSAMVQLRAQKRQELEELRKEQEARENQLVNVGAGQNRNNPAAANRPGANSNGFLNIRNQSLVANAKAEFRALWGDRPLADNWRVAELIESAASSLDNPNMGDGEVSQTGETGVMEIEIDISNVPFTEQAQDSVQKIISGYQYELGNLFFISLNMPDSASTYYTRAIDGLASNEVKAVSLYSLSELEAIGGNNAAARNYAQRLITEYPESVYARRLADQYNLGISIAQDSANVDTLAAYYQIADNDTLSSDARAMKYRNFAKNFTSSAMAPQAMYDAIFIYMQKGKEDSLYNERVNSWVELNNSWEQEVEEFSILQDSLSQTLEDTTTVLSDTMRVEYESLVDSSLTEPDFYEVFPYKGAYWDSARTTIGEYKDLFANASMASRVNILSEELEIPEHEEEVTESAQADTMDAAGDSTLVSAAPDSLTMPDSLVTADTLDNATQDSLDTGEINESETENEEEQTEADTELRSGYVDCQEIRAEMRVRGGKQQIVQNVSIPESVSMESVRYRFYINQRGGVDDYSLLTEDVPEELENSFRQVIDALLTFEPVMSSGQAVAVQCDIDFPLDGSD